MSSEKIDPGEMAAEAARVAKRLLSIPFDPRALNSPPWHPQFRYGYLGQRMWRERWLWALYQLEDVPPDVRSFMHWTIVNAAPCPGPMLEAARSGFVPTQVDWGTAAQTYLVESEAPPTFHLIWPLQVGGTLLDGPTYMLPGAVRFVPAGGESAVTEEGWHPAAILDGLRHVAPDFMDSYPVNTEIAVAGFLDYRPDGPLAAAQPDVWQERRRSGQTRLFLTLSALRLAAPGMLVAPYSLLVMRPLFLGVNEVTAYTEPPHGHSRSHLIGRLPWPSGANMESTLASAGRILEDLFALSRVAGASLVEPGVMVAPGPVTQYTYRPLPYWPKSYLEFALYMLDVSLSRPLPESVIDLWAAMEALYLAEDDPIRGAGNLVAKRAAALLGAELDPVEGRHIRGLAERFGSIRTSLTHGRHRAGGPSVGEWEEYYDLVRRSTAAAVGLAAKLTREGQDASEHTVFLGAVGSLGRRIRLSRDQSAP